MSPNEKRHKITPLNAWAFSFACSIGWAAYIMPATVFLPEGGILGSVAAFLAGGAGMCVIALCYHYLDNILPSQGGIYHLIKASISRRTGFIAGWSMGLAHMCCIPLNAKAMAMLVRIFLEEAFGLDFEVQFFGSGTLLIEAALIVAGLLLFGLLNIRGLRQTALVQTVGAIVLLGGVVIMFIAALAATSNNGAAFQPLNPPDAGFGKSFLSIYLITPWAFVGFDSLSKVSRQLNFPVKKIGRIMIIAICCGTFVYLANIFTTLLGMPAKFGSWPEYLESLQGKPGVEGYPVALAAKRAMGQLGTAVFFASCISATLTGLVGFFASVSRLISEMAQDHVLPASLGVRDQKRGTPVHAIWLVVILAMLLSLMRDSFDFIEQVASFGTAIGFGLCALATLLHARLRSDRKYTWIGLTGTVLCLIWLFFMLVNVNGGSNALSFKSTFLLLIWVFAGILCYSFFTRDRRKSEIEVDMDHLE